MIGADSLGYLSLEHAEKLAEGGGFCTACFSDVYPTRIPGNAQKDRFERKIHQAGE